MSLSALNPSLKMFKHLVYLQDTKHAGRIMAPLSVEISPTNYCNAKCPWCFYVNPLPESAKQSHSKNELDFPVLQHFFSELAVMGTRSISWTGGGDPSVYSHIDEAIECAHVYKLKQGMFTNAYKPIAHPELLEWIRVTVTEKYTITKHVTEYAKKTKVGVNYNLCAENYSQLRDMMTQARDAGAHYFQIRPALADTYDKQQPVAFPEWAKAYETANFKVELTEYKWRTYMEPHGYPVCHGHRMVPFVWYDGNVDVCAYHKRTPGYTFGNLYNDTFHNIWYGEKHQKMLEDKIKVIPSCQHNCKLHEINQVYALVEGELDINNEEFV